jgi:hypothetical protein
MWPVGFRPREWNDCRLWIPNLLIICLHCTLSHLWSQHSLHPLNLNLIPGTPKTYHLIRIIVPIFFSLSLSLSLLRVFLLEFQLVPCFFSWRNFVIFRHINWRFFISKMSIRLTLLISFIKISPKFRYEYLNLKNLHWLGLPTGGKFYDIPNWRPKPSPNQKEKPLLWEGSITFSSISENSSYVSWEQSEERTTYSGYVVCVG